MFSKNETTNEEVLTLVGKMVKVQGDLKGQGNMIVEGLVEGGIETTDDLRVEQGGIVRASVKAKNVYIAGIVEGNIKSQETVELAAGARVYGDIEAKFLAVEKGAWLCGNCKMGEEILNKKEKVK